MSTALDMPDVGELCDRLCREASARAVVVFGALAADEERILGHAGATASLSDAVLDAVADLTAEVLGRTSSGELRDSDDLVQEAESLHLCGAALGARAALVVVFDEGSNLTLVRLRMKRARELILRSLEAR
jgi:hypothetical protein